jgi:predicted phage tail protein
MIAKFLASRFAGPIVIALIAAVIASLGFGGIQSRRLSNCNEVSSARLQTIEALQQTIATQRSQLAQRDGLIAKQNAAVEAIQKARAEDREVYLRQYAAADQRAKSNDARARSLLSLTSTQADEIGQCREARQLLEQELVQ